MDCCIPFEQIQPRRQPMNPMNENAEMERGSHGRVSQGGTPGRGSRLSNIR